MTLFEQILGALPELADKTEEFGLRGSIELRDDSDGQGAYIAKWEYSKPLPDGMKVGKN
jgi:hypothetical protein